MKRKLFWYNKALIKKCKWYSFGFCHNRQFLKKGKDFCKAEKDYKKCYILDGVINKRAQEWLKQVGKIPTIKCSDIISGRVAI